MSITVRAADAAQFLALVPRVLGFTPTRSLVLLPMEGQRSLGAMRFDLPADDADADHGYAATAVGMVCRVDAADGFLAVIYTPQSVRGGVPHAHIVAGLARTGAASGLTLLDVLLVGSDGWLAPQREPAEPHPLSELLTTPPQLAGLPSARDDQSTGTALPPTSAADRRRVSVARRALDAAVAVVCGLPPHPDGDAGVDPAALAAACELDDLPTLFENALHGDAASASPQRIALLSWCLARPSVRDVALVQWATDAEGGAAAVAAQRRWEDGAEYPVDLASVLWGEVDRPDPARLEAALTLTRQVAALSAKGHRAGPLAVCAWLSWALGRSTHAEHFARQALVDDPEHGLADIVVSFVASAHLPDWAFRRGSAA